MIVEAGKEKVVGKIGRITQTVGLNEIPEDLRGKFLPGRPITVTFEGEMPDSPFTAEEVEERKQSLLKYWGAASHLGTTTEEAVARVRALRDEWD